MANGAQIIKPLTATAWGTKDFYIGGSARALPDSASSL